MMTLSIPSTTTTPTSSPKEETVAPLSPQDIKFLDAEDIKEGKCFNFVRLELSGLNGDFFLNNSCCILLLLNNSFYLK